MIHQLSIYSVSFYINVDLIHKLFVLKLKKTGEIYNDSLYYRCGNLMLKLIISKICSTSATGHLKYRF